MSDGLIKEVLRLDVNALTLRPSNDSTKAIDEALSTLNATSTVVVAKSTQTVVSIPDLEIIGLQSNGPPVVTMIRIGCSFSQMAYSCSPDRTR